MRPRPQRASPRRPRRQPPQMDRTQLLQVPERHSITGVEVKAHHTRDQFAPTPLSILPFPFPFHVYRHTRADAHGHTNRHGTNQAGSLRRQTTAQQRPRRRPQPCGTDENTQSSCQALPSTHSMWSKQECGELHKGTPRSLPCGRRCLLVCHTHRHRHLSGRPSLSPFSHTDAHRHTDAQSALSALSALSCPLCPPPSLSPSLRPSLICSVEKKLTLNFTDHSVSEFLNARSGRMRYVAR